jgi:hypothetical protein
MGGALWRCPLRRHHSGLRLPAHRSLSE